MEWINKLSNLDLSGNKYSQFGEEKIIQYIFSIIGITDKFLVDIGAGGAGRNLSNTKLLLLNGWKGLLFDMDGQGEGIIQAFVKPDNIVSLLKDCPKTFDFLSIDIDSFDYDVLDNLLPEFKPRLICAEFNGTLDPNVSVKLKYEDGYTWDGTNKYGFSFLAGVNLFEKHGYTVILNHCETNLFAIKKELLSENPKVTAKQTLYHPINSKAEFIKC